MSALFLWGIHLNSKPSDLSANSGRFFSVKAPDCGRNIIPKLLL
ncbi:hypothetical protein BAXH7_00497 [Bacillus amyloliquefaciens XH7]|nr:hypothetical protein BAXH7_00497 [Bacillus amyloliquefaciens XH7]